MTGTGSDNNTILHNITYANEDSGLQFYAGAQNNIVIGNLSYGNGDHGIDNNTAPNNTIVGNTVQGNVTAGINLEGAWTRAAQRWPTTSRSTTASASRSAAGRPAGSPTNIRVDATSVTGTTIDYDVVYLNSGSGMIQWNGTTYNSLSAVPGSAADAGSPRSRGRPPVHRAGRGRTAACSGTVQRGGQPRRLPPDRWVAGDRQRGLRCIERGDARP